MLFNYRDLKELKHQLEYIDTAIIPVIEVDYRGQLMAIVDQYEVIQMLTLDAENQFKGRVLLVPPVQVQEDYTLPVVIGEQLKGFGMKHILFVTPMTSRLETAEDQFKVNIFPLASMDDHFKQEMMEGQVKDLMRRIIAMWNK
ncbi:DUF2487 family protein [Macrococcus equipercicus]|uniref:DUF2487 family protein n=1 Tax=Macrococcus equipercicus TaxID=69967 RepID=A0A9Q9BRP4_9STAP|nr:DUF2487 family protein [Macrococcus equipercicus]KAA1040191.1 DUF2487 family protein [Macrococcus equipercicus]UTH12864.1 DUF2487 family protein [Macrococcus equipercicus]